MTLFRPLYVCLILAAAPGYAADDSRPTQANLPAITVSTVATAPLTDRVFASGLVGPVETVLVQPQIQGQAIESIEAEVGDTVSKGQVLARLSDTELTLEKSQLAASHAAAEATIAQAEAQLVDAKSADEEAERVLKRAQLLKAGGNVSQASLDTASASAASTRAKVAVATQGLAAAEAQLKLVDAKVADVDLRLQRTEIVAPVGGVVVERNVLIGAIASTGGDPMFQIVRDGELELKADVAETDILKLAEGQKARLRFVGLPAPLDGVVRLVEPRVDTATRLGRVRISIADPSAVRSGMFAEAEVTVASKQAPAIPVSALGGGSDGAFVLKVTDGVVRSTPVTTGIRDGGLVEITGGVGPGDTVVTKAGAFVRDGDHINPVPAETSAQASN